MTSEPDDASLARAEAYLDAGRPQDALRLAGAHVARHPDDAIGLVVLALAERSLGRHVQSVRTAGRATAVDPDSERAWRVLALTQTAVRAFPAAKASAERAIALAPHHWATHVVLAITQCGQGDPDALALALRASDEAVRLAPAEPEAHLIRGNALLGLRQLDEAAAAYAEVLRLEPAHELARNNLGVVQLGRGRFLAATKAYARILGESPDNAVAHRNFQVSFGSAALLSGWLGLAALVVSLRIEVTPGWRESSAGQFAAVSMVVAALVVSVARAVRLLGQGRGLGTALWRRHPLLAASWSLSTASLVVALVLYLAVPPSIVIETVVLSLAVASLATYYLGASRLEKLFLRDQDAAPVAGQGLDAETARQAELFTVTQEVTTRERILRGSKVSLAMILIVFGVLALFLAPSKVAPDPTPLVILFGFGVTLCLLLTVAVIVRARQLTSLRRRRDELESAAPGA